MQKTRYMVNLPIADNNDYAITIKKIEVVKKLAEKSGHSLSQYICKAINDKLNQE